MINLSKMVTGCSFKDDQPTQLPLVNTTILNKDYQLLSEVVIHKINKKV